MAKMLDNYIIFNLTKCEQIGLIKEVELKENSVDYLGFSTINKAYQYFEQNSSLSIVAFWNLFSPMNYLVKLDKRSAIDFAYATLDINEGINRISFYKGDFFKIVDSNGKTNFNTVPVLGSIWSLMGGFNFSADLFVFSVENRLRNSDYLKNIYILYFWIPFILILWLIKNYRIQLSFLFYLVSTIFLDPYSFWIYGPFMGVDEALKGSSGCFVKVVVLSIIMFFIMKQVVNGFKLIKRNKLNQTELRLVILFLLLPIILRI